MRSRKDHWFDRNPAAKRFINTCATCGRQGYAPQIDNADFAGNESTVFHRFTRAQLKAMLSRYYEPLVLDDSGRCEDCARRHGDAAPGE
jgi:ribosomal protein S14